MATTEQVGGGDLGGGSTSSESRQARPGSRVRRASLDELVQCEELATRRGVHLLAAVQEWAEARDVAGTRSLVSAVREAEAGGACLPPLTVAEAHAAFLEDKAQTRYSPQYQRELRCMVRPIVSPLGGRPIAAVTVSELQAVIYAARSTTGARNYLRSLAVTLFRWARRQGYLPLGVPTVAERVSRVRVEVRAPLIWTPAEFGKLLGTAPATLLPVLVLGGFGGLRTCEICRLEWKRVDFERGFIEVTAQSAKVRSRRLVPLLPALRAWLEPYRGCEGPVVRTRGLLPGLCDYGARLGLPWRFNALRHSYASYRLASLRNAPRVSLEMGNSPERLFTHYRQLVLTSEARLWFALRPDPDNPPNLEPYCAGWEGPGPRLGLGPPLWAVPHKSHSLFFPD